MKITQHRLMEIIKEEIALRLVGEGVRGGQAPEAHGDLDPEGEYPELEWGSRPEGSEEEGGLTGATVFDVPAPIPEKYYEQADEWLRELAPGLPEERWEKWRKHLAKGFQDVEAQNPEPPSKWEPEKKDIRSRLRSWFGEGTERTENSLVNLLRKVLKTPEEAYRVEKFYLSELSPEEQEQLKAVLSTLEDTAAEYEGEEIEVAEQKIMRYIKEELRTVLQEDYTPAPPDEDEESFTGIEKVDYIIDDLQKRNILHLLDSQEERGAFLKWIVGEYIDDILPEDLHDLMHTVLRGHTEREDEEDEAHHDEREDELFDDLEAALDYEQEEEIELAGELDEVYSQKQRRWACAQKDKPAEKRKKSLSKKEADEMCKSKELKKKKPKRGKK